MLFRSIYLRIQTKHRLLKHLVVIHLSRSTGGMWYMNIVVVVTDCFDVAREGDRLAITKFTIENEIIFNLRTIII